MSNPQEKEKRKLSDIVYKIFLVITSPIWFPWKVLFVRKPGDKFKDVSTEEKIFRLVRSPITKPLKLLVFLFILFVEVMIFYKVRFSVATYPITRNSVHNYYLTPNAIVEENPEQKDNLSVAFDYIDEWDLDSKNKMYVIFDAEIVKWAFRYGSYDTTDYILSRFDTDAAFRDDIHYIVANIDSIFSRALKELPNELSHDEFDFILDPLANLGSTITDYRAVLDALAPVGNTAVQKYNLKSHSHGFSTRDIEKTISMIIDFSKGTSLKEALDTAYGR